ncbi:MAG: WYL domain-containing transcriptional regulator [Deltaproteobacteria bacterium]|nr:MAG: WYL domain-containing transcriptional regulator [Deltaproteobacteria bacterium]
MNKAQKLVKMVELMSRRGGVAASELSRRFDLDARTLRRYLSDLKDMDIPIQDDGRGESRIVSIDAQWRRTGVQLSLAEVLSLHFGRTLFNFLDGTSFAADLTDAIERLEPAISRADADLARQLDTKFVAVPEPTKRWTERSSEIIDEVISALVYNNPVDARYQKVGGMISEKELHPYTLATYRQGLYLFGFDVANGQVKTYALERFIDMKRRRSERFEAPSGWEPRAHIAHAFGIISAPPEHVAIAFSPQVTGYIRERVWHPTQTFRTRPDGWLELGLQVGVTIELVNWICSFGADALVVDPLSLRDRVAQILRAAAARYEGGQE